MKFESLEITSADGVASLWLNRPDVRNAFDDTVIADWADAGEPMHGFTER